jgi:hypothetical protein
MFINIAIVVVVVVVVFICFTTLIDAQLCCDDNRFDYYFDFSTRSLNDRIKDTQCISFPNSSADVITFDTSFDVTTGGYRTIGRPNSFMVGSGLRAPANAQVFNAFVRFQYHGAQVRVC